MSVNIGDVVKYECHHDSLIKIGVVYEVGSRHGVVFVRPDHAHSAMSRVVEIIESATEPAINLPAKPGAPEIGDDIFFIPHDDGIARRGKVAAVHLLRTGEALVRIGRPDAPLCRLSEAGSAK
jgi:hypothetical protein